MSTLIAVPSMDTTIVPAAKRNTMPKNIIMPTIPTLDTAITTKCIP